MKNNVYYSHIHTKQYEVLAKGFTPFQTDSMREAMLNAKQKSIVSDYVSLLDDGDVIFVWKFGHRFKKIR